jgi:uncharacterized protein YbjQ (UPF0145 family)
MTGVKTPACKKIYGTAEAVPCYTPNAKQRRFESRHSHLILTCAECGLRLESCASSDSAKGERMPLRMDPARITTAFILDGFHIVRTVGIVRGIVVRSRSVIGNLGAALQTIVGGNITIFTELCEKTREDAFELMVDHAVTRGANAIIGMRYDATEIMNGVTEVLAYGTAVIVEPNQ